MNVCRSPGWRSSVAKVLLAAASVFAMIRYGRQRAARAARLAATALLHEHTMVEYFELRIATGKGPVVATPGENRRRNCGRGLLPRVKTSPCHRRRHAGIRQ